MPPQISTDRKFDIGDLQYDIEDSRKSERWADGAPAIKELFHQIEWNVINGEHDKTTELIQSTLANQVPPRTLIAGPMATGIAEVSRRFKLGEYFLPEVMMSAKCMHAALGVLKPLIVLAKTEEIGTVVVGTVQGDLHDIGKKIVAMMLEAAGFTVIDLGVSVPAAHFIAAIREHKPQIVGLSALLTTTMNMQGETIRLIAEQGLREQVKVLIGGAACNQAWCDNIGADGYAADAMIAVDKVRACTQNYRDLKGGDPNLRARLIEIDSEREVEKVNAAG